MPTTTLKSTMTSTGSFALGAKQVFYKCLPLTDYARELSGYQALRNHYPVPQLLASRIINNQTGLLLFEYEESIGPERGLLLDLVASGADVAPKYAALLEIYRPVFKSTLQKGMGDAAQVFFADRVHTRLEQYYTPNFITAVDGARLRLNGEVVVVDLAGVLAEIRSFYAHRQPTWCVLSQCDFHDLNVGLRPVFFDFLAGGSNPLMAEFATQFWYNLVQGSYLAPKYNAKAFTEHQAIYRRLDQVAARGEVITHHLSAERRGMINLYIDMIVAPIVSELTDYQKWYIEFKNYLAMKMLAVFDLSAMAEVDRNLTLGYLMKFYRAVVTDPRQLKEMI